MPKTTPTPKTSAPKKATGRPLIRLSTEFHRDVDAAVRALAKEPSLYERNHALVHILRAGETDVARSAIAIALNAAVIREIPPPTLRECLSRCATFARRDARAKAWRATTPPIAIVNAVHARGTWAGIRPLMGIIESPSLRPDGTVLDAPGYDRATGFLYEPDCPFPRVKAKPTREDAREALAALRAPFCDFQFASPLSGDVIVGAILTLIARPAIDGAIPCFGLDASAPGSGKSLLADAIATIATGRGVAKMSLPANDPELEKVLGAYAMQGASLVCFDNAKGGVAVGGAPLDRVLTARPKDGVELRVLGRSEVPRFAWLAMILVTGNNLTLAGDLARRVLLARLEPDVERPELRSGFEHPDLLGWLRGERPRLVAAALTLLRAYIVAGKPGAPRLGSFEEWSELVAGAISYAGGGNILDAQPSPAIASDDVGHFLAFLEGLPALDKKGTGLLTGEILQAAWPFGAETERGGTGALETMRLAIEGICGAKSNGVPSPNALGKRLASRKGQVIGGRKLVEIPPRIHNAVRWGVESMQGEDGSLGEDVLTRFNESGRENASSPAMGRKDLVQPTNLPS